MDVPRERFVFIVSDSSGLTCETVVKAALTQFSTTNVYIKKYSQVQTVQELKEIMEEAANCSGVVAYTFVITELRREIIALSLQLGVPIIDILGPVLSRLQDLLELSPLSIPGLFRHLNQDYYDRIECINFAVKHDDGRNLKDINQADLVLLGVSRSSKTPISIYLAYRGIKTANIPIVYGRPLPEQILKIPSTKVIGLTVDPERLRDIRLVRAQRLKMELQDPYVDLQEIKKEVNYALMLFKQHNFTILDVTSRSIEESATTIMEILGRRLQTKEDSR
ncbi:MAG TPA: pyruvate, water dikinase regulatory protein [Candidatus Hydrothermia bacterium]|nr:kinase/pyrophosphorylase [Candidatus Hydrothermae bacterium]MDD3649705.1 kinase/pyrophosphorylase [Candidatus Hydrothermia bacterium]MDD5573313.1 kinase/pyrophosphorylase [Candidatus Hydrothermia bacterium]HOK23601.1 pyruvate, water dikinase regulatory protein [Candidatus Hydrothermia bacterium]HOL24349.1 pyruvate, water dikinase regulatory protein [Candidatus Hydrothermia bacterium]